MNQDILSFAFQSIPFVAALVLGLLVPVCIVGSGMLAEKWSDSSKIAVILGVLIVGNALSVLLSGRLIYSQAELALNPLQSFQDLEQGRAVWAGRFTNGTILFVSLGEIFRWFTGRRKMPAAAKPLLLAFMAFYLASYWVGVAFATSREISLSWVYAPIAFTALALLSQTGMNKDALTKLEWVLLAILAASLIGAAVVPKMTVESGYKSWIPGFTFRLYGFAEHANSLGIIAALSVILQLSPYVRKRPNLIFLGIAMFALIFTQSKTAWMVALIGVALVRFEDVRSRFGSTSPGQFSLFLILMGTLFTALGFIVLLYAINAGLLDRLLKFQDAVTFTGRTRIWEISWNEFLNNPLFGYGPALWDLPYRYQKNFLAAGQAHNQFFQTAGQAGLLGLLSWFWYIFLLGRNCASLWASTCGLAAIGFLGLMIRCFSESPMRLAGLTGMDAFAHLLAFAFAASLVYVPASRRRATAPLQRPLVPGEESFR
ncbi:O-antigen ligase family protein [Roseateles sp. P5_E7]